MTAPRTDLPPPAGIDLRTAARLTGYTVWQLRKRAYRGTIRSRKCGKRLLLHPDDVTALAGGEWRGNAVTKT